MSETPRDPNNPGSRDEWLPDDPATEDVAPPAERPTAPTTPPARSDAPAYDQGAIERERNRKAQADADAGIAVTNEPPPEESEDEEYRWHTGTQRPTGKPDAVEFVDVHKAFGRNKILRGLNMGLPEGQISMILGPSGTGKSVCIKHMVGLLYPDDGDVLIHGESVPNMQDDELFAMRKKFGVLFQDGALFGSMNLYDNTAFPLRQHTDKGEDEIGEIVNRRLREVGLADAGDKMPNELSGGMRKRAALIRTLVYDPPVILMDEPFGALDAQTRTQLQEDLLKLWNLGRKTIVFVTHDITEAIALADRTLVLSRAPARIVGEHAITIARPRDIRGIMTHPDFAALYQRIRVQVQ